MKYLIQLKQNSDFDTVGDNITNQGYIVEKLYPASKSMIVTTFSKDPYPLELFSDVTEVCELS